MNEIGVVISRYWQTLKWIESIKAPLDIYIYNRRGTGSFKVNCPPNFQNQEDRNYFSRGETDMKIDVNVVKNNGVNLNIINIEDDRGYDGSTYLHHCYSKHNSLNKFTLFIQGHGYAYHKDMIKRLNNPESLKYTKFTPSSSRGLVSAIPETTKEPIEFEIISDRFGSVIPDMEYGWSIYKNDFTKAPWWEFCKSMPEWSSGKPPGDWSFGEGSQFIVCKKRILLHEPDYYKRVQHFVNTYLDPRESPGSWCDRYYGLSIMEGLWQWIF